MCKKEKERYPFLGKSISEAIWLGRNTNRSNSLRNTAKANLKAPRGALLSNTLGCMKTMVKFIHVNKTRKKEWTQPTETMTVESPFIFLFISNLGYGHSYKILSPLGKPFKFFLNKFCKKHMNSCWSLIRQNNHENDIGR